MNRLPDLQIRAYEHGSSEIRGQSGVLPSTLPCQLCSTTPL